MKLKRDANAQQAAGDISNLVTMMEILAYPLAIFINIASEATHAELIPPTWKGRLVCFAVTLRDGEVHVTRSVMR